MSNKHPGGRPTKYKQEYNEQVIKLCRLGATDKEIADFFNVCEATVNNWKLESSKFLESIKRGKMESDINVNNSLYKRANGYDFMEIKEIQNQDGVVIKREIIQKHIPPDTTAMIYWHNNRQRAKWNNKEYHHHVIENEEKLQKELEALIKKPIDDERIN